MLLWNILAAYLAVCISSRLVSAWTFSNATLAINERSGTLETQPFSMTVPLPKIVSLPSSALARIRLVVRSDLTPDQNNRPHQAYASIEDPVTKLETSFPIDVRENGRGRVDIDYKMIPAALLGPSKPLTVKIILASFGKESPLKVEIGQIQPIYSGPEPVGPVRFGPKPEIIHTFRSDPKFVSPTVSILFSAIVGFATLLLIGGWLYIEVTPSKLPVALAVSPLGHFGFFASIVAIEVAFFNYYLGSTIFKLLAQVAVLAPIAFLSGSRALREVRRRRLRGQW
ncbi:hypothetical protein V1525DRAFT_353148 [Lipomyces kononenkoae]|uniref:Uncharacterized protein n=1 Tax=Lipomyces kononenkoae TaxID=34357 RepID=A0ACC3T9L7_LIPKO